MFQIGWFFVKKSFALICFTFFCFNLNENNSNAVIQKTFGLIKPSGIDKEKEIKSIIASYNLKISQEKRIIMTEKMFEKLYSRHNEKPFYQDMKNAMVNKEVIPMIIYGDNAIEIYQEAVHDIRFKYSNNKIDNAIHCSNKENINNEISIFFPNFFKTKTKPKQTQQDVIETKQDEINKPEEEQSNTNNQNVNVVN